MSSTLSSILDLQKKYSDIPLEAIIKQDLLRQGVQFTKDCYRIASGFKPKDYFIFSFDLITLKEMEQSAKHLLKAPEEIRIRGGKYDLEPTIINVRLNPGSPFRVDILEGKLQLYCGDFALADVDFHPLPTFYDSPLSSDKKISEIAPVLEWGYLIYLTVFRLCQYWGKEEECQFCDINENYRQQKQSGRAYTGVKKISDIIEALEIIQQKDTVAKAITITGGSITGQLSGRNELEFYLQYAREIKSRFGNHWIVKAVVEAFNREDCKRLREEGEVDIYHPNYEVWDADLFKKLCPGKERFVGRREWIDRIVKAADIFGPENVIPNFVAGVEMAQPYGFTDLHQAVDSTTEGLDFFMSRSIMPRFTTWCPEPLSFLKNQTAPPLEYYIKLLRHWRDTKEKYELPNPPGYGEAGLGKAVFSVSAFMDVIR